MKRGSLRTDHALATCHTITLSHLKGVNSGLFTCPRCCHSSKLFFRASSLRALHCAGSSVCCLLKTHPCRKRSHVMFLQGVYCGKAKGCASLSCCLSTLLLRGGLSDFTRTIPSFCLPRSALPHCCQRTLALCRIRQGSAMSLHTSDLALSHFGTCRALRRGRNSPLRRHGHVHHRFNSAC